MNELLKFGLLGFGTAGLFSAYCSNKQRIKLKNISKCIEHDTIFEYQLNNPDNVDNLLVIKGWGNTKYTKIYDDFPGILCLDNVTSLFSDNIMNDKIYMSYDKMKKYITVYHPDIPFHNLNFEYSGVLSVQTAKINKVYMYGETNKNTLNVKYISDNPTVISNKIINNYDYMAGTVSMICIGISIFL